MRGEGIDFEFSEIESEAGYLPKLEKLWPTEDQRNRFVYKQEWHNLMGALQNLEESYREGAITPEQELRYRELKALLEDSVPILKRLGFTVPPVPLDG